MKNPWDELSQKSFNTYVADSQIDPKVADNILIAWPPILNTIKANFPNPKKLTALDYGCGSGAFCMELNKLGFTVDGIDTSVGMIAEANKNSPYSIGFYLCDSDSLAKEPHYEVITSIMTLQFIENIEPTLDRLVAALQKDGIILFADFNQEWVKECLNKGISFSDFDSQENPVKGKITFNEIKIPVFIRDAQFYDNYFLKKGFEKILAEKPPFTEEFIKKYPDDRPKNISEYLILGYKKLNQ